MVWLLIILAGLVIHGVILSVFVVLEHRHPIATLVWILLLIFVPFVGVVLYYFFGRIRFVRRLKLRERSLQHLLTQRPALRPVLAAASDADENQPTSSDMKTKEPDELESPFATPFAQKYLPILPQEQQPNVPLISLAQHAAEAPLTSKNGTTILQNAKEAYAAIEKAIREAKHHVHVVYYILRDDSVGKWLRDLLAERAEDGITVRVLVDGLGSYSLSDEFWAPLRNAGASVETFLPFRFARFTPDSNVNFRNHRKLVVVDGHIGLTGGINMGEEYLGKAPFPPWRDTHVRIEGPAVTYLQQTFIEDWCHATEEHLTDPSLYPDSFPDCGDDWVQIIPSGPDHDWYSIHLLFFLSITSALQRIWIATPYFIPDNSILTALITATMRGVDVSLLLPSKGDHPMVHYAMRSYYKRLLKAGVKIYEYQKGMMHSKTMVVDSRCGTIGSANLDIRSFHLNFELNAFVYSQDFASQLEDAFQDDLQHAKQITLKDFMKRPFSQRLYEAGARVFSPLL